jgi:hypothetical protein
MLAGKKGGSVPSVDQIEAEFWRLVETPAPGKVVETLYGSDLDSGRHGSGFPLPVWRGTPTDAKGKPIKMDAHCKVRQGSQLQSCLWRLFMGTCAHESDQD